MGTITDPVIFHAYIEEDSTDNYSYKAVITENEESAHYLVLYTVGIRWDKEPRKRWILLDLIEYKASEDRGEAVSVIQNIQALDSMYEILTYARDVYNKTVRFKDLPQII